MNEQLMPVQQMPVQQMPMQQMPASGGLAPVPAVQHTPMQRAKVLCSGGQMLTGCAVLMNIVLCLVIMSRQGPSACPAPSDTGHHEMTSPAAYNHGYMGAALAVAGGCLGAGYAAANGGTMLSAVLSAPIAVFGLIIGVILVGAMESNHYCERAGFAHLWAGVASGAASVAGGLAIGMTQFINADCDACAAEGRCTCVALRYLVALFACLIGNGIALVGLILALVMSSARCERY